MAVAVQTRLRAAGFSSPVPIALAALGSAVIVGVLMAVSPRLGLGALIFACFVPVAMLNLAAGIALWIPLVFLSRLPVLGLASTILEITLGLAWLGAGALAGDRELVSGIWRRHRGLCLALGALVIWVTMSLAWASDLSAAANDFWSWWVAAAVFIVVATTMRTARHARWFAAAFVVGAVASVVAGVVVGTPTTAEALAQLDGRFGGSAGDPNVLAVGLVPAIAIAAGLFGGARRTQTRVVLGIGIVILAAGLAATGSRGGLVAAAVSVIVALVLARGRRLRIGALAAVAVAVGGLWIASNSPDTWNRVRDFDTGGGTGRVDLWSIAWDMAADNPILGVGANNFRAASGQYITQPGIDLSGELTALVDRPLVAHNVYLQQLAETGIVGLALLLSVIAGVLTATWRACRAFEAAGNGQLAGLAKAVLVGQLAALSASMFLSNGYDPRIWIVFAMGPGLLAVASRGSPGPERH
jgi:O-antigen ligase